MDFGNTASMDEGSYGTCLNCEDPIPEKRLRALLWAILCLGCQERHEREPAPVGHASRRSGVMAFGRPCSLKFSTLVGVLALLTT